MGELEHIEQCITLLKSLLKKSRKTKVNDELTEMVDDYFKSSMQVRETVERDLNYIFKLFALALYQDSA